MLGGAYAGDLAAQFERDVECFEVDVEGGTLGLAEEDGLGQRGPVVRLVGFGADQRDGAGEALFAQGHGGLDPRHPGADDDDVPPCLGHRCLVLGLLAHRITICT